MNATLSPDAGARLMAQADALAAFTSDAPRLTRTYLSPEHRQAADWLIALMREAGFDEAGCDALGNIVGRYHGRAGASSPVVMSGSHQDSVRNAGRYDGPFGILCAIECVRALSSSRVRLPFTFEVVGFGDEEGVRFGLTLIGSKAMAGAFDPAWLDKADADGTTLARALRDFGGDPAAWASLDRRGRGVVAYLEVHIEQGPVLLDEGLPVGVVTSIAGATRARIALTGLAGHAGTVPMHLRRDALAAAAEMVSLVERRCGEAAHAAAGLVGTVGTLSVAPGAVNVIPQDVAFTIDVRAGDDATRHDAVRDLRAGFEAIAARRRVALSWETFYEAAAAPCAPGLQALLARAVEAEGVPVRRLASGAGHDAMVFPAVCPTAMLFVRCGNGGISHHPDETMTAEDARVATAVLLRALQSLPAADAA